MALGGGGACDEEATQLPQVSNGTDASASTDASVGVDGGDASDCTVRISPSDDDQKTVQSALIDTPAGSTICFDAGTFKFTKELTLTSRGVTLRGAGPDTVWEFRDQQTTARNGLLATGSDFTMEGFTIKNTPGDGVRVEGADGVTFRKIKVLWEPDALHADEAGVLRGGAYALYPVSSSKVLVEECEIIGARDAGIYVGQSHTIIVRNNVVHANVAGVEIENSTDADVYGNQVYDNTAGILVFNLPDLPTQDGRRANVHDNVINANNRENFGVPGTTVAGVPPGTGALILSADQTEFNNNTVTGNDSTGVLVVSCFTNNNLSDCTSTAPGYDEYPQQTYLHDNTYSGNGNHPASAFDPVGVTHLEDVAWDGDIDTNNPAVPICIGEPGGTFRNFNSRAAFSSQSTDASPYNCTFPALPPVTL